MSPRRYTLGKRQQQIDEGREQILDAASALLKEAHSYSEFTVEAVARRAGVARATVYYQFKSKTGVLEGLCDQLAALGGTAQLAEVLDTPDADQALVELVTALGGLWQVDRAVMRRLLALAALDPEVNGVIAAREERRRRTVNALVRRMVAEGSAPVDLDQVNAARVLVALTSFPTFDALRPASENLVDAAPEIVTLAKTALR